MKSFMKKVDNILCSREEVKEYLEAYMSQPRQIPDRVAKWKKSTACCGADVALALTRVLFPKINEEKLQSLSVANPKGYDFQEYLVTFMDAATRIIDAIDLNIFIDPVGSADNLKSRPPVATKSEEKTLSNKFASEC